MPDGITTWDTTHFLVDLMLGQIRAELDTITAGVGGDVGALLADINALRAQVNAMQTTVSGLSTTVSTLNAAVTGLQQVPLTFAFAGTPVEGSMINVPLSLSLTIPALNSTTVRYYNATHPLAASVFTLTRITSTGATSTLGTINKPGSSAAPTFTGSGSSALVAGDTLRLTATTVGGSLANIGITFQATRR